MLIPCADLTFGVQQDCHREFSVCIEQPDFFHNVMMGVMSPMGEIWAGYIHPCIGKVFKDFGTVLAGPMVQMIFVCSMDFFKKLVFSSDAGGFTKRNVKIKG